MYLRYDYFPANFESNVFARHFLSESSRQKDEASGNAASRSKRIGDSSERISARFFSNVLVCSPPRRPSQRPAKMPKLTCWSDQRRSAGNVFEVFSWPCNVRLSMAGFPAPENRNRDRPWRQSSTSGGRWTSSCPPPYQTSFQDIVDNDIIKIRISMEITSICWYVVSC